MSNYTSSGRSYGAGSYRARDRDRDRERERDRDRDRNRRNYSNNRSRYYDRGSRNYSPPRRLVPDGGSPPRSSSDKYRNSYSRDRDRDSSSKSDYNSSSNRDRPPSPKGVVEGYPNPGGGGESFYTPPESLGPHLHPDPSSSAYYNAGEHLMGNHNHMLPPHPGHHPGGHPIPAGSLEQPGGVLYHPGQHVNPNYPYHPPSVYGQEYTNGVCVGPGERPHKPKKPKKEKLDINGVVAGVISQMKTKGIFDKFRRECLSESDTKPSYSNLHTRVTTTAETFLRGLTWTPSFPKMNARNQMRKRIEDAPFFKPGIENIVEQCLRGKMGTEFIPVIETETFSYMGCDKKDEEATAEVSIKMENGQEENCVVEKSDQDQINHHQEEERPFQYIGSECHEQPHGSFSIPPPPASSFDQTPPTTAPPPPPTFTVPPPPPPEGDNTTMTTAPTPNDDQTHVQMNGWNQSEDKDDEEMETCSYEDEAFVEDEDSEDESPMFEKIGEVSPPRPVYLENSDDILRELQEEARRNAELMATNKSCAEIAGKDSSVDQSPAFLSKPESSPEFTKHDSPPILTDETAVDLEKIRDECKFLEPPPLFKEKLAYYKKLPECGGGGGEEVEDEADK